MKKITLKFLNPSLEKDYQTMNKSHMMLRFYFLYKFQLGFITLMMVIKVFESNFAMVYFMNVLGLLVFAIINLMLKKWFKKAFDFLMIFVFSFTGIFLVEQMKLAGIQDNNQNGESVILAFPLCFSLGIIMLSRTNWIFNSIIFGFNFFYLMIRFYFSKKIVIFEDFGIPIFLLIFFMILTYNQEKSNRGYFQQIWESNQNLKQFKEILQSILPSPIFILNYKDEKIEFSNKCGLNVLKFQKHKQKASFMETSIFFTARSLQSNILSAKTIPFLHFQKFINEFYIVNEQNRCEIRQISDIMQDFCSQKTDKKEQEFDPENFLTIHVCHDTNETFENNFSFKDIKENVMNKSFFEVKMARIKWDGKSCLFVILNDNTNSKHLMEMINIDNYKNQMLATISHDLRTPLNAILGIMTTVSGAIEDPDVKNTMSIGVRSANLLNYLINDILDFSQLQYKKLRLHIEKINMSELMIETFELIKIQAETKKIELSCEMKGIDENETFLSDPTRIKQILLNLLGNALKFTDSGSITFSVEQLWENTRKFYIFSVQDTGIGIKEDDLSKLFVLFGKLKQENNEVNKTGIGLGLTISNKLAKMLNTREDGGVHVESQFGNGSRFWFRIQDCNEQREVIRENDKIINIDNIVLRRSGGKVNMVNGVYKKENHEKFKKKSVLEPRNLNLAEVRLNGRILIVDDDSLNLMVLEKYLEFYHFTYLTAMNGLEAVNIIKSEVIEKGTTISAILMDCNMPIMNGFTASEKILELLKSTERKEIPIIAVTANVTHENLEESLKMGIRKFLGKPVSRKELGKVLENILEVNLGIE